MSYKVPAEDRKTYNGVTALLILNLSTGWESGVSFTPRLFYLWGNNLHYPLNRKLGGP
jgi:hypothetical protein